MRCTVAGAAAYGEGMAAETEPDPFADSVALAARMGAELMTLTVASVEPLSPTMVRVVLDGDALRSIDPLPGQDLMLTVPGVEPKVRRRWTMRRHDKAAGTVWLDIALHEVEGISDLHRGPVGGAVEAIGPRGKVHIEPTATHHHFLGDQSFLPAAFAMAESVQPPAGVVVTLAVPEGPDRLAVDLPTSQSGVRWVDPTAVPDLARALVETAAIGGGIPGAVAYVGGEMALVTSIRSLLVTELGWDREAVKPKPYWRRGMANARHGEPAKDDNPRG